MYRKDKGVPVTEAVQKEFIGLRDEFGLTQFKFPFEENNVSAEGKSIGASLLLPEKKIV